jgi:hypothetical protein
VSRLPHITRTKLIDFKKGKRGMVVTFSMLLHINRIEYVDVYMIISKHSNFRVKQDSNSRVSTNIHSVIACKNDLKYPTSSCKPDMPRSCVFHVPIFLHLYHHVIVDCLRSGCPIRDFSSTSFSLQIYRPPQQSFLRNTPLHLLNLHK